MDLARLQAAVARLAVNRELRGRFLDQPARAAEALGLSASESEDLARRIVGLAPFADSLVRKRLGAVRRLLPRTAERLGARFEEGFRRYVASRPSQSPRRHERDALKLAAILRPDLEDEDLETLSIEAGWIEAGAGRRFLFRRLPSGYGLWLRIGGSVRFWRLGRGPSWTTDAPAAQESEESS